MSTKTKEFRINELKKKKKKSASQYQKLRIHNFFFLKKKDNLHFLPNNILTWISKELTKYKNNYQ